MITLYPDIEPYATHIIETETLPTGDCHRIYVETCGNPHGIPVIFLHGGPGSGCRPSHRRFFDPDQYHIILFDQRGCGRSTPYGELVNNTTQHLIADMELIRQNLHINRWLIFGGSWGATLGLIYAQRYPDNVLAMILRGVFLARQQDIDWAYQQDGAPKFFPDKWQQLMAHLAPKDRSAPLNAYYDKLTNTDDKSSQMAEALQAWEGSLVSVYDDKQHDRARPPRDPLAPARIQLHYIINQCFIADTPILDNMAAINDIQAMIIHGRFDMVCPVQQAWTLCENWHKAELNIVPLSGHVASDPAICEALILATRAMATRLS